MPLLEVHDGRALVDEDGLVRVDTGVELVTQLAGLDHGARMAWMAVLVSVPVPLPVCIMGVGCWTRTVVEEVEAAVDPDAPLNKLRRGVTLESRLPLVGGGGTHNPRSTLVQGVGKMLRFI